MPASSFTCCAAGASSAARPNAFRELRGEPRLADARRAEHGDEVGASFALDALPGRVEKTDLPVASDERRARQVARACGRRRRHGAPGLDRLGLPLRRHGLDLLVLDRASRRAVRLLADDDLADGGVLLQA